MSIPRKVFFSTILVNKISLTKKKKKREGID
jgi:hypothetical protein